MTRPELPPTTPPQRPTDLSTRPAPTPKYAARAHWESEFTELEYAFLQLRRSLSARFLEMNHEGAEVNEIKAELRRTAATARQLKQKLEEALTARELERLERASAQAELATESERWNKERDELRRDLDVAKLMLSEVLDAPRQSLIVGPSSGTRDRREADTVRPPKLARAKNSG